MIKAVNVSKSFGDIKAVDNISVTISEGNVFGLLGTNGAGKSTFLRMLAGVYKTESGTITLDGMMLYENVEAKRRFFYIPDTSYFFMNATPYDLSQYYRKVYDRFDVDYYKSMLSQFELDMKRKISTFSKGMQKQISLICGICAKTEYIFCDETFDGLDPVMRQAVKSIFAKEIEERGLTPVIASHNLRELEELCDHVGLLHKGEVLLSKDLLEMKLGIYKIQCVLKEGDILEDVLFGLELLKKENKGALNIVILRCSREEILECMQNVEPVFYEILPLSLEEIFIFETEVVGYDIHKLIL